MLDLAPGGASGARHVNRRHPGIGELPRHARGDTPPNFLDDDRHLERPADPLDLGQQTREVDIAIRL